MSNILSDLVPGDGAGDEQSTDADAPLSQDAEEGIQKSDELAAARCIADVDPQVDAEEVSADDKSTDRPTV